MSFLYVIEIEDCDENIYFTKKEASYSYVVQKILRDETCTGQQVLMYIMVYDLDQNPLRIVDTLTLGNLKKFMEYNGYTQEDLLKNPTLAYSNIYSINNILN